MIDMLGSPIDMLLDAALIVACCGVPVCLGLTAGMVHNLFLMKGTKRH